MAPLPGATPGRRSLASKISSEQLALGEEYPDCSTCWPVAALNLATSSAGTGGGLLLRCPVSWPTRGHRSCSHRQTVRGGCRGPACGHCRSPGGQRPRTASAHPAIPWRAGVQVDLILSAVQRGADGTLGGAAVDVIDEQGLYLLSYGRPGPLTGRLS